MKAQTKSQNIEQIIQDLKEKLPEIGKEIASQNTRLPEDYKKRFLENLDSVQEHQPKWHEWGIITHTYKTLEAFEKCNKYLPKDLQSKIEKYLEEEIDGVKRRELIRIALILHDVGKFEKGIIRDEQGNFKKFDFNNHEQISERIILTKLKPRLESYGLTENQIKYIASCAGHHYELGLIRKKAKKEEGFNLKYVRGGKFEKDVKELLEEHPELKNLKIEMGLMYLVDNLGKIDITIPGDTDEEIERNAYIAEREIKRRNLDPRLINAVKQLRSNVEASIKYLELVVNENYK